MIRSIRAQLTLWYVGVLALVLIILSAASYFVAENLLYRRMDASLLSSLKEFEQVLLQEAKASPPDSEMLTRALEKMHYPNRTFWVVASDGRVLATKKANGEVTLRLPNDLRSAGFSARYYELEDDPETVGDDSCHGVFERVSLQAGASPDTIVVAQSDEVLSDELDSLQNLALIGVPVTLLLAASGGWFLARRSLAPIALLARTVRQITAKNLEGRVPIKNPDDEIGSLSSEFNQLVDRLAVALTQQREFMTDASHELRTPLSVMRTTAEVTLGKKDRSPDEYREALDIVKQQAGRLSHLVDGLFALARADMGERSMHATDFYLEEVVEQLVQSTSVLALQKKQRIETALAQDCLYHGDENLIRQMILALLDNAIKYTPEGGSVKVNLESRISEYAIAVSDTGPGIPESDRPHIFDRFFRGHLARTASPNGAGGTGLGLAIARSIAELHHGQVILERSDSSGSKFLVLLPRDS